MRGSWLLLLAGVLAALAPLSQAQLNIDDLGLENLGINASEAASALEALNLAGAPCINYLVFSPSGSSAWRSCENGKCTSLDEQLQHASQSARPPNLQPKDDYMPSPCRSRQPPG